MDKIPEGLFPEPAQDKSLVEYAKQRMKQMNARAEAATKALGLEPEDKFTVLSAIYDTDYQRTRTKDLWPEGFPESEGRAVVPHMVASMIIVDTAAQALMERMGLPSERRYEVMRVLWGKSSETGEEPNFEDSIKEAVEKMEAEAERAATELGLPSEKQGDLLAVLYGESGKDIRDQYRAVHPKEPDSQSAQ